MNHSSIHIISEEGERIIGERSILKRTAVSAQVNNEEIVSEQETFFVASPGRGAPREAVDTHECGSPW
jgi:hypothetical protein